MSFSWPCPQHRTQTCAKTDNEQIRIQKVKNSVHRHRSTSPDNISSEDLSEAALLASSAQPHVVHKRPVRAGDRASISILELKIVVWYNYKTIVIE